MPGYPQADTPEPSPRTQIAGWAQMPMAAARPGRLQRQGRSLARATRAAAGFSGLG
jgi:hypothetical protein